MSDELFKRWKDWYRDTKDGKFIPLTGGEMLLRCLGDFEKALEDQSPTPEAPTEPGWYWFKGDDDEDWEPVLFNDDGIIKDWLGDEFFPQELEGQWSGPIKAPK